MRAEELTVLLQCPKKYELKQVILDEEFQKYNVKKHALGMLAEYLADRKEWDAISGKMEAFLQENLKASWFELHWQKKAAVRNSLFRMKRLYCWFRANIRGTIYAGADLEMEFQEEYEGCRIRRLQITADLIAEEKDGAVLGILLYPKFPDSCRRYAQAAGKKTFYTAEMLCLMGGMKRKYPDRAVDIMIAGLEPEKAEEKTGPILEDSRTDHMVRFTELDFPDMEKGGITEALRGLLMRRRKANCRNCVFEDICRYQVQTPLEDPKRHTQRASHNACPCGTDGLRPIRFTQRASHNSCPCGTGGLRPIRVTGDTPGEQPAVRQPEDSMDYTEDQKRSIRHRDGPLRVCAGPGAGKTAVLTARIRDLIEGGHSPERILAVTFTKNAAKEILARVSSSKKPVVSTLHALAFGIVRQHEYMVGRRRLATRVDCMQMLLQVLNEAPAIHGICYEKPGRKHGFLDSLLRDFDFINKQGIHRFEEVYPDKDTAGIFCIKEMYGQKFHSSGYILYDDQVRLGAEILESSQVVRQKVQESYDYIMVDEAQDLDEMQSRFIRLLVKAPQNNIAIYGDADQSIYGFRGGSNRFMLDFPVLYPEAADIRLADNFRSSAGILDAANTLIGHNHDRVPFRMQAHLQGNARPVLIRDFRSNRIGAFIHDLLDGGCRPEQIAVIARTNRELESMCGMLETYNSEHPEKDILQYDWPKYYLYQSPAFQDILDLLALYLGIYSEDKIWYRLLLASGIHPDKKDCRNTLYEDYLDQGEILPFDAEEASVYLSADGTYSAVFQAFAGIYRASSFFSMPPDRAVPNVTKAFCGNRPDSRETAEVLGEMIRERNIRTPKELWQYLTAVKKFHDETRLYCSGEEKGRIHLLTAHDSKGKEFEAVLVYGVDAFERGDPQEDRRLLYVALTRAKEKLYVTEICKGKSMFLREFREKLDEMGGLDYA